MKITGIIVKDSKTDVFFAYIKQFPGICAQANTVAEVKSKIDSYYKSFMEKMSHEEVQMDESNIETY